MTTIYCYSGTGNTLAIAKAILKDLGGGEILPCTPVSEHPESERVGFLFPVYFGGLPRGLIDFLRAFPARAQADYFAIASYGGMALNALHDVRDLLAEKGAKLRYGRTVKTVANNIALYNIDIEHSSKKLEEAESAAHEAAAEIAQGKVRVPGARIPLLSRFMRYPPPDADRAFVLNRQACQRCGRCVEVCVRHNIDALDSYPLWNGNCDQCMACVHWCPVSAIDYGLRTVGRNRYHHPDVAPGELPR